MKRLYTALLGFCLLPSISLFAQMHKVKTVFVIMMENHNRVGNDAGASFDDPDIDHNPLAPYTNNKLKKIAAQPTTTTTHRETIPASRIICGWKPELISAYCMTRNQASRNSTHTFT